MTKKSALAALLFGAAMLAATDAHAVTNLMFILNSSGSMWGKVDDQAKIDTAKAALSNLTADLPANSNLGLMVYGHRNKSDCNDVETVMPIGSANEDAIAAALTKITPLGKTPLTLSLQLAGNEFAGREKDNNAIVLISDGKANCGGDPCAAAAKLAASGINVKVHVVGFDLSADEQHQLQCIADQGGGKFFNAKNTGDFKTFIKQVPVLVKQEPPKKTPPPVAKPGWNVVFEDNFDGDDLAEQWTLKNPNPDAYVVEGGELLILSAKHGELSGNKNTIANMLVLDRPLPKGDWRITMRYRLELGTFGGWAALGLFKDPNNRLQAFTHSDSPGGGVMRLKSAKVSAGTITGNRSDLFMGRSLAGLSKVYELRLLKNGRSYISQARLVSDDPKEPNPWLSLPKLTSLRPVGPLFVALNKGDGNGEDLMYVDWVKIEQLSTQDAAGNP